ncbi:hypothetical protein NDU88_006089 [Pleurodeles waltl]|uniref:Uncharacterized protein n=1 Tax=Pleurodeles waltl TaxID=8319 RepID=A0AAV7X065_PLEWA|nr:hypothetical protein NDU88_006089 [Pleurodeles waltl]
MRVEDSARRRPVNEAECLKNARRELRTFEMSARLKTGLIHDIQLFCLRPWPLMFVGKNHLKIGYVVTFKTLPKNDLIAQG